jgi:hypothetical protein
MAYRIATPDLSSLPAQLFLRLLDGSSVRVRYVPTGSLFRAVKKRFAGINGVAKRHQASRALSPFEIELKRRHRLSPAREGELEGVTVTDVIRPTGKPAGRSDVVLVAHARC